MKKIILSGKSGFIGNNIFEELMKSEYLVESVDLRKSKDDLENNYSKKILIYLFMLLEFIHIEQNLATSIHFGNLKNFLKK